jgi:hypothetical protein
MASLILFIIIIINAYNTSVGVQEKMDKFFNPAPLDLESLNNSVESLENILYKNISILKNFIRGEGAYAERNQWAVADRIKVLGTED